MELFKFDEYLSLTETVVNDTKNPTILFTDIVGSSKMWQDDSDKMYKDIDEHFELVNTLCTKYGGFIVKTIGDAFMVYFAASDTSLLNAIKFSIDVINTEEMGIRIGIYNGEMEEKECNIQGVDLKDYFGNSVNSASRLESKVADEGTIAFSYDDISDKQSIKIKEVVEMYEFEKIEFDSDCRNDISEVQGKRSGRLLNDIQVNKCLTIQELKGVEELTAYKVKIK